MLSILMACQMGLVVVQPLESELSDSEALRSGTPIDADLVGKLYVIAPDEFLIIEPSGLEALKSEVFATDILIYISDVSSARLQLVMAFAGEDGRQSRCEPVRTIPTADWENPYFHAGPGDVDVNFSGTPARFYDMELSGTFKDNGARWERGEMSMVLDGRELSGSLGGDDACALAERMGGSCIACRDEEERCIPVAIDSIEANGLEQVAFDPRETGDCQ
jgi:hypothetical protein